MSDWLPKNIRDSLPSNESFVDDSARNALGASPMPAAPREDPTTALISRFVPREVLLTGDEDTDRRIRQFVPTAVDEIVKPFVSSDQTRVQGALLYAGMNDIDPDQALAGYDVFKDDDAGDKLPGRWLNVLKDRLMLGVLGTKQNKLGARIGLELLYDPEAAAETLKEIQGLQSKMGSLGHAHQILPKGLLGAALGVGGAVAEMAPSLVEQTGATLAGAVTGAALSAGATAAAGLAMATAGPGPTDLVTGPAAFLAGAITTGAAIGGTAYMAQQMRGSAMVQMLSIKDEAGNGLDPLVMSGVSIAMAAVLAPLGQMKLSNFLRNIPGGRKLVEDAIKQAQQRLVSSGVLKRLVTNTMTRSVGAAVGNSAIDVAQAVVRDMYTDIAKTLTNATQGTGFEWDLQNLRSEMEQFATNTAAYAVVGLAGNITNMPAEYADLKRGKEALETIRAIGENPTLPTVRSEIGEKMKMLDEGVDSIRIPELADAFVEELGRAVPDAPEVVARWAQEGATTIGDLLPKGEPDPKKWISSYDPSEKVAAVKKAKALAKVIMRPMPEESDWWQARILTEVQKGIDPMFRSKKTLAEKARLDELLAKNPDEANNIPKKLLGVLGTKSLNELSLRELQDLAVLSSALRETGKESYQIKQMEKAHQRVADVDEISKAILKGAELKDEPVLPKEKKAAEPKAPKKGYRFVGAASLDPYRLFPRLDGKDGGPLHKLFVRDMNRQFDQWEIQKNLNTRALVKNVKALGFELTDMAKTKEVNGHPATVDTLLKIVALSRNPHGLDSLEGGFTIYRNMEEAAAAGVSPDKVLMTVEDIQKALTPQELKVADTVIDLWGSRWDAQMEWMTEALPWKKIPGEEESYTPKKMDRDVIQDSMVPVMDEVAGDHSRQADYYSTYVRRGHTYARSNFSGRVDITGLVKEYLTEMPKHEYAAAMGEHAKRLKAIVDSPEVRAAIRQKYGAEALRAVERYERIVANPYDAYRNDEWNRMWRLIRRNTATKALAFNVSSVAVQGPALVLAAPEVGMGNLLDAAGQVMQDPIGVFDMIASLDPQWAARSREPELESFRRFMGETYWNRAVGLIGEKGTAAMAAVDKTCTAIQWIAAFNKATTEGKDIEASASYAQEVVLKYQPSANLKDAPSMFRTGNELFNVILQFTKQQNQIWNMAIHEIPRWASQPKTMAKAVGAMAAIGLNQYLIWTVRHGRPPQTDDEIKDLVSETTLGNMPYIGKMVGSTYGNDAPLSEIADMARALKSNKKFYEKVGVILPEALGLLGLPVVQGGRVIKAIEKNEPGLILGTRK